MAPKKDYYQLLGVSRDAAPEEIKKAFRKLAFQSHPDRNHQDGAAERFKEINEAYEVLGDPEKRARYDYFGYSGIGRSFEGFGDFVNGLGDVFEAFFAGSTRATKRVPRKGDDLYYEATITFEEAAFGCEKRIEVLRTEDCSLCGGLGGEPGSQSVECPNCDGVGEVRRLQQSIFGRFVNRVVCQRCHGEGSIITQPCGQCRGTGKERRYHQMMVKVPAGVEDGSQIRLSGEGEAGMCGGGAGSLYITLHVSEHSFFKREGNDILYELPLNFAQAALGDVVEVPTLDGEVSLRIAPGTQTGEIFQLKGKGICYLHRPGRGNLLVKVRVITPERLNEEQRGLFHELAKSLERVEISPQREKRFFSRIRKG